MRHIKRRIFNFINYKIPFFNGWNLYHNPLYHWFKVRKYFKRPKIGLYYGKITWRFGFPIRRDYYNRVLDFRSSALGWKDKYDSPRFEWHPYIMITFLRKWQIIWTFYYEIEHVWEAILDVLYYNKSIEEAIKENTWININTGKEISITKYIRYD